VKRISDERAALRGQDARTTAAADGGATIPGRSAGVPPAVAGASRPRGPAQFERAKLTNWRWVWVRGQDARTTAAADGGATIS
jgi:hypothetical protein